MSRHDETRGGRLPAVLWAPLAVALAGAATMLAAWVIVRLTGPQSAWLLRTLTSRLFITCEIVLVACVAAMAALATFLWHAGKPYRTRPRGQDGVAILEFALAMPIMLMMSLLMGQTSLVMVGNGCVHYSAFCAARAAIVAVPLNASQIEPRNEINPDGAGKIHRVKMAAAWALMPVSCGSESLASDYPDLPGSLETFFTLQPQSTPPREVDKGQRPAVPAWVDNRLSRKFTYAMAHTTVTMPPPTDPNGYGEKEDLRVDVRHTLYLSVPYAARIFSLFPGGQDFGNGEYGTVIQATCTLTNEGVQDYVDTETFPPDP